MANRELREDGSFELREDGSFELREGVDDAEPVLQRFGSLGRSPGLDVIVTTLRKPEPRRDAVAGGVTLEIVAEFFPGEARGDAMVPGAEIAAAKPTPDQAKLIGLRLGRIRPGHPLLAAAKTDRERLNALFLIELEDLDDISRIT